jgi:RNA polymerase sigma factor (sigma-70 family)
MDCDANHLFEPLIENTLLKIVTTLERNPSSQEDLMQEALVHFWRIRQQKPGQTLSWYLQSCRFHLLNHLNQGRSLDSLKRRHIQCLPDPVEADSSPDDEQSEDFPMGAVSARDLIGLLSEHVQPLDETILRHLAEGYSVREVAAMLHLSHQAVSKRRRKIAAVALDLGAVLPPG